MQESGEDSTGAIDAPSRRSGTADTTRRLLDAAAEEFLARGYEAARVSDIARRGGVTTGAVYARWRNKNEVLVAALDHIFHQILPEQRLKSLGGMGTRPDDMMTALGASLVAPNDMRDVMVQVFGSARNNEAIRASLQRFLNEEADQLRGIVEIGKDLELCDPDLSTAALSLLSQAIGLGTDLLLTAGLDERNLPTEDEWDTVIARLIAAVAPATSSATESDPA